MLVDQAALRVQRRSPVYAPLRLEPPQPEQPDARAELRNELACYVCKRPFAKVHRYYDSLCEPCGDFNYAKREQTADLGGHYALVTGARVKIGYQAALKLLRAGAHVIVTTRFPVDAASRYARESDFASSAHACRSSGSTCATRRAWICSRGFSASGCRGSTTFSTTRVRRCGVPPGSFAICSRPRPRRSLRCRPSGAACSAHHDELCRALSCRKSAAPARSSARRRARAKVSCAAPRSRSGAISTRTTAAARRAVPGESLRRGPPAGRPARDQQLAAAPARGRDAGAARGAARERGRAVHLERAAQAADGARRPGATSTS